MYKPGSNPAIKQAVDAMNTAMASGDNDAALAAFEQFGQAVADTVRGCSPQARLSSTRR